jgi:hypothetical protein
MSRRAGRIGMQGKEMRGSDHRARGHARPSRARVLRRASLLGIACLVAGAGAADADSCREWRREHALLRADAVRVYLRGESERAVDAVLFELLQREAYLTSCDDAPALTRAERVGWRLVDRAPDDFGAAVLESVLAQAGFPLDLRLHFSELRAPRQEAAAPVPSPRHLRDRHKGR